MCSCVQLFQMFGDSEEDAFKEASEVRCPFVLMCSMSMLTSLLCAGSGAQVTQGQDFPVESVIELLSTLAVRYSLLRN